MPFDSHRSETDHTPARRHRREDLNPVFTCPVCCGRQRINLYAIADEPEFLILCPNGTLKGCGICGDAFIDPAPVEN